MTRIAMALAPESNVENPAEALAIVLGHRFAEPALLRRALTHGSAATDALETYERLEFLGDRVLGLCVADLLLQAFPGESEGRLARRLNALVRREALAEVAVAVGLEPHIRLGKAERAVGTARRPSVLADVCEAVIAALYLDGGLGAAMAFIRRFWEERLTRTDAAVQDAKSALQEWTMARNLGLPQYEVVERRGPDHAPDFTIEAAVSGVASARADGTSHRDAEQRAAQALLERLRATMRGAAS